MRTLFTFLLICVFGATGLGGCGVWPRNHRPATVQVGPRVIEGDFNDINAVVAGVLPKFNMIDIPKGSDDPTVRRFVLRRLDDRPGTLVFRQLSDNRLEMNCTVGRFGDPALESSIMDAMTRRFTQILGDVAVPMSKRP